MVETLLFHFSQGHFSLQSNDNSMRTVSHILHLDHTKDDYFLKEYCSSQGSEEGKIHGVT